MKPPPSELRIRLRDLPVERQLALPGSLLRDALAGLAVEEEVDLSADPGAVDADLAVDAEGTTVFVRGRLTGWVPFTCSRCLATARLLIDEELHLTLLPHGKAADGKGEIELGEEDLDVSTYQGDEVDLEPHLREQVALAVPIAPLCRDDCKGLCLRCGADLNSGPCGCPAADGARPAIKM